MLNYTHRPVKNKNKERKKNMDSSMVKTDCFGYRRGECKVLYELVCKNHKCSFYKTCEEYRRDHLKYSYKGRENY